MSKLTFDDLVAIYRSTSFDEDISGGRTIVADQEVREALLKIEGSELAAADANIFPHCELKDLVVGAEISVEIGPPRIALGILASSFDALLHAPRAYISEPHRYFVVSLGYERRDEPAPEVIKKYRRICQLISVLGECASFFDKEECVLVFVGDEKHIIPVKYDARLVNEVDVFTLDEFLSDFSDSMHKNQKLGILSTVLREVTQRRPPEERFAYIIRNIREIKNKVDDGYRLFASSFSYEKTKGELEAAKIEYISKIHKTLTDIQGQALGLPLAAIVVATQLEEVSSCGKDYWGNYSVLLGAWVFGALLLVSVFNQIFTLLSINSDVKVQRNKMWEDHKDIAPRFNGIFCSITRRMIWHAAALFSIGAVALFGIIFSTVVYLALTDVSWLTCVTTALKKP